MKRIAVLLVLTSSAVAFMTGCPAPAKPPPPPPPPDAAVDLFAGVEIDPVPMGLEALETFLKSATSPEQQATGKLRLAMLRGVAARMAMPFEMDSVPDFSKQLRPVVDSYRRLLADYPSFEQRQVALYDLAHALIDSEREPEAMQVLRALVCANHFSVHNDEHDQSRIAVSALPQDHDKAFWQSWLRRNAANPKGPEPQPAEVASELSFIDPYPDDCQPARGFGNQQQTMVAEAWWWLGQQHRDGQSPPAGPYSLNRAVRAYEHALQLATRQPMGPMREVVLYSLAFTQRRQGRHQAAVETFMKLLQLAGQQADGAGATDVGREAAVYIVRSLSREAAVYIVRSLSAGDFLGPGQEQPCVDRMGEMNEKLAQLAVERLRRRYTPKNLTLAVELYKALASLLAEQSYLQSAVETVELALQKYPDNPFNRAMQKQVALLYEQLARDAKDSAEQAKYRQRASAARTKIPGRAGTTTWSLYIAAGAARAKPPRSNNCPLRSPKEPGDSPVAGGAELLIEQGRGPTARAVRITRMLVREVSAVSKLIRTVGRCDQDYGNAWVGEAAIHALLLADGRLVPRKLSVSPKQASSIERCIRRRVTESKPLGKGEGHKALELTLTVAVDSNAKTMLLIR